VEEVKNALFLMKLNNYSSGPDSIPIEFFHHCWDIVMPDVIHIFHAFHVGHLVVQRFNYGMITLLSKMKDANKIQQFRPICLLLCIYELITKTLSLRLDPFVDKLFSIQQNPPIDAPMLPPIDAPMSPPNGAPPIPTVKAPMPPPNGVLT
jgi:hypothetical protein